MCLSIFFLDAFKISSLFIINNLTMLGLGVIFSGFLVLGFIELFRSVVLLFSSSLINFCSLILQIYLHPLPRNYNCT